MLCRHFDSNKGCIHQDKCQFAHGVDELRSNGSNGLKVRFSFSNFKKSGMDSYYRNNNNNNNNNDNGKFSNKNKKLPNPNNFKIQKCENFEKSKIQILNFRRFL